MLKSKFIPSRLIDPADRKPVEIRPVNQPPKFRSLLVEWRVLKWAVAVLSLFLTRRLNREVYAKSVRQMFEDLGGLWIKVGQLLSFRIDMFSIELCRELSNLQGQAAGFPPELAKQIVERELGGPIERYFDTFDHQPFAAASIGQIHRARLREEGVWVAVKIQRPYLGEIFARDLAVIQTLVRVLRYLSIYHFMHWEEGLRELREIMREELDCRYEASAFYRMKKSLKKHRIYVPKVFPRYTTKYILVTEFIHATLMADYIKMANTNPVRLAAWLQENNIDPRRVAGKLTQSMFRQLFEDNLYHGDMHPGNVILLRENRVALIDFGAIAFTELEYLQKSRLFIQALVMRDYAKAADTVFLLSGALPKIDLEEVKEKLIEQLRAWGARTLVTDLPYHDRSLDNAFVSISRVMFQYRCGVKWALMRLRRAAATLDASIIYLYPNSDTNRQILIYMRRAERRVVRELTGADLFPRMVKGIATVIEVAENSYEQALYQGSLMRRQAQVFEGTTTKFDHLFSVLYRQVSVIQIFAGVLFTLAFLYQHYPSTVKPWMGAQFTRVMNMFPFFDYQMWLIILAVNFYLFLSSIRLGKMFAEKQ